MVVFLIHHSLHRTRLNQSGPDEGVTMCMSFYTHCALFTYTYLSDHIDAACKHIHMAASVYFALSSFTRKLPGSLLMSQFVVM